MGSPPMAAVVIALVMLVASPAVAIDSSVEDEWGFDVSVYVWLPTIEGKLAYDIPGFGDKLELDPGTILDDLKMTGMLAFEARKDRWSILADVIYLDLGQERDDSVPLAIGSGLELDLGAKLELVGWVAGVGGGYDVVRTDRARLGVLAGVRYFSMETDLSLRIDGPLPPQVPTENYSQRGKLWNGIVGVKGHYGEKWQVSYYLDVGTGDSDLTWQAMAGVGYRFRWGNVFLVYRYLDFRQGEEDFIRDLNFGGPAVGVGFRF